MARKIDFSTLTAAERAVIITGSLLFADGFIPWWYRISTSSGSFRYNAGFSGWGTAAVIAGAAAAVGVLLRAMIWPEPAPRRDGAVYALLGTTAMVSLLLQLARPGVEWIGLYVGLILACALTAAGIRRHRERRSGWI